MTKAVVKTIISKGRKILVLKRHPDTNQGGKWDLPGGKLSDGETLEKAARREAFEETHLRMGSLSLVSLSSYVKRDGKTRIVIIYHTTKSTGRIRLAPKEHTAWEWIDPAKLTAKNTAPALLPAITAYRALKRTAKR